jgi:hypothetical protein
LIPTEPRSLRRPCSVTSNRRVHHDGQDACTSRFIRIDHVAQAARVVHNVHSDHDYPNGTIQGYNDYNEV